MESVRAEANEYAEIFGLTTTADATFYPLCAVIIMEAPLGSCYSLQ
jgi:hypothetical protein